MGLAPHSSGWWAFQTLDSLGGGDFEARTPLPPNHPVLTPGLAEPPVPSPGPGQVPVPTGSLPWFRADWACWACHVPWERTQRLNRGAR